MLFLLSKKLSLLTNVNLCIALLACVFKFDKKIFYEILKYFIKSADIHFASIGEMCMNAVQNHPVNFFMAGGMYISDNFNMQIIDTSNPNAFDDVDLTTIKPDMMQNYINSEPSKPEPSKGGIMDKVNELFGS